MTSPFPARPSLDWLRKRARATLKTLRQAHPGVSLAQARLAVAREYGFPSWRALKVEVDRRRVATTPAPAPLAESEVADFLRRVGEGDETAVRAALAATPGLVNAVGPHPFWGGRPQPLHVAIETNRPAMVRLLLRQGADVNGNNAEYLHWSPLLLTYHRRQPAVRRALLRRGARIGLVEALVMGDDRRVLRMLRAGRPALPAEAPNGGSLLMFARAPRAIDRLLELGVPLDRKDRWGATPLEAFSRMGPRGRPLVRHLARRGVAVEPEASARMNDRKQLAALLVANPERVRRLRSSRSRWTSGIAPWCAGSWRRAPIRASATGHTMARQQAGPAPPWRSPATRAVKRWRFGWKTPCERTGSKTLAWSDSRQREASPSLLHPARLPHPAHLAGQPAGHGRVA